MRAPSAPECLRTRSVRPWWKPRRTQPQTREPETRRRFVECSWPERSRNRRGVAKKFGRNRPRPLAPPPPPSPRARLDVEIAQPDDPPMTVKDRTSGDFPSTTRLGRETQDAR